ncbi:MAG: hypothetical protein KYX68_08080 [Flavobacterium sp.]|nr:hypothetical protein [Flavobacterium sp.]
MDNFNYTCGYCGKNYIPKRRKVQKYCSASCRTRACQINKVSSLNKPILQNSNEQNQSKLKIDQMSFAGIGNAAVGTFAVNSLTSLLTKAENKPATKKDIEDLKKHLTKRFFEVKNMQINHFGELPFFDIEEEIIIYLKEGNYE